MVKNEFKSFGCLETFCFQIGGWKAVFFETCFLDELWQAEQWGQEEESTSKRKRIYKELKKIVTLIDLTKL